MQSKMYLLMRNSQKTLKNKPKRILGIDPGYERVGIAVVERRSDKDILIHSECFKTSPKNSFEDRLKKLGMYIENVIETFEPEILSIENLFLSTNQKTAMRVAEARGAIIYIGTKKGLNIREFTPLQVKIAVTGYGKSDKRGVDQMVRRLIRVDKEIQYDDEMDAIAIAIAGSIGVR